MVGDWDRGHDVLRQTEQLRKKYVRSRGCDLDGTLGGSGVLAANARGPLFLARFFPTQLRVAGLGWRDGAALAGRSAAAGAGDADAQLRAEVLAFGAGFRNQLRAAGDVEP